MSCSVNAPVPGGVTKTVLKTISGPSVEITITDSEILEWKTKYSFIYIEGTYINPNNPTNDRSPMSAILTPDLFYDRFSGTFNNAYRYVYGNGSIGNIGLLGKKVATASTYVIVNTVSSVTVYGIS